MIDYIVVSHPTAFPQSCVCCLSQKGPFVDTHRESSTGHVYVCAMCAKTISRVMGFAEGAELDELADAARIKNELMGEVERLSESLSDRESELMRVAKIVRDQSDAIEFWKGRASQLEERIRQSADAALSLVGGPPEAA